MIRRIGAGDPNKSLALLIDGLKSAKDDATRLTFLRGLAESLKGRKNVEPPATWQQVKAELVKSDNKEIRFESTILSAGFGDPAAAQSLANTVVSDPVAPTPQRRRQAHCFGV